MKLYVTTNTPAELIPHWIQTQNIMANAPPNRKLELYGGLFISIQTSLFSNLENRGSDLGRHPLL